MNLEVSRKILYKYSNIIFHESLCSQSRVVAYRRTDGMIIMRTMKLIVAFRNFSKAPDDIKGVGIS